MKNILIKIRKLLRFKDKTLNDMSKMYFKKLPKIKIKDVNKCSSIIIIPILSNHESDFKYMKIVPVYNGKPLGILKYKTDLIQLNGIGGSGISSDGNKMNIPKNVGWEIDCLRKSKYIRLVCNKNLKIETQISMLNVFSVEE